MTFPHSWCSRTRSPVYYVYIERTFWAAHGLQCLASHIPKSSNTNIMASLPHSETTRARVPPEETREEKIPSSRTTLTIPSCYSRIGCQKLVLALECCRRKWQGYDQSHLCYYLNMSLSSSTHERTSFGKTNHPMQSSTSYHALNNTLRPRRSGNWKVPAEASSDQLTASVPGICSGCISML